MMRPRADDHWRDDWYGGGDEPRSVTVLEERHEQAQKTGLLDARGNPFYRPPERRRPAGFLAKWSK